MRRILLLAAASLMATACGNPHLLVTGGPNPPDVLPHDGGPHDAGQPPCRSDCDCVGGTYCATGVLGGPRQCIPGQNTCPKSCGVCDAGTQCNTGTGTCDRLHCPTQITCPPQFFCDPNGYCEPLPEISVDGGWKTYYSMDVSSFASNAQDVLLILDILNAIVAPPGSCPSLSTPTGQLICFIVNFVGISLNAPAWVSQLLSTLEALFKFGNSPVSATGLMTLTQGANHTLSATETWSTLWVNYNGQVLNLMNNPVLGTNGNITVTINAFGGTRDATNVYLGSRDVSFDVDKFLIALLDVAINAASGGQATDVPSLLDLVICDQIPDLATQLLCYGAVSAFVGNLSASSGLGGFTFDKQDAVIYAPPGTYVATELSSPTTPGLLQGSMTNGIVSGNLGPTSGWYGTR